MWRQTQDDTNLSQGLCVCSRLFVSVTVSLTSCDDCRETEKPEDIIWFWIFPFSGLNFYFLTSKVFSLQGCLLLLILFFLKMVFKVEFSLTPTACIFFLIPNNIKLINPVSFKLNEDTRVELFWRFRFIFLEIACTVISQRLVHHVSVTLK